MNPVVQNPNIQNYGAIEKGGDDHTFKQTVTLKDGREFTITLHYPKTSGVSLEKAKRDMSNHVVEKMVLLADQMNLGKKGLERIQVSKDKVVGYYDKTGKQPTRDFQQRLEQKLQQENLNPLKQEKYKRQLKAVTDTIKMFDKTVSHKPSANKCKTVGPLGSQWKFPSDHMPVGTTMRFTSGDEVKMASFNVLNTNFIKRHITEDTDNTKQGLQGSACDDLVKDKNGLTKRDREQVENVKKLLQGRDFLALQECSPKFLAALKKQLPSNYVVLDTLDGKEDGQVYIYDKNEIKLTNTFTPKPFGNLDKNKMISQLEFERTNGTKEKFCVVGVHMPGGGNKGAAQEILKDHLSHIPQGIPVVLMGDMNDTTDNINTNVGSLGFKPVTSKNPTAIGTNSQGKPISSEDIDSIHARFDDTKVSFTEETPNSLMASLGQQSMAALLSV